MPSAQRGEGERTADMEAVIKALRDKWSSTRDGVLSPGLRLAVDDLDREWFQATVERKGAALGGADPRG